MSLCGDSANRDMSAPSSGSSSSSRNRWITFTLSGAIAAGVGYWMQASSQPRLGPSFQLPSIAAESLPADMHSQIAKLKQALQSREDVVSNLTKLGRLAHASGLPEIAAACWLQLAEFDPTNAKWPYYLADLARSQRDDQQELVELQRSIALDPTYAPARLHLGNLYLRTGQIVPSKSAYEARLNLIPDDAHARMGLIRIARREGRMAERLASLQELVEVAPDFPSGHNLLAAELSAAGKIEAARKHRWLGHSAGRWTNAPDPWLEQLEAFCFDPGRLYVLATRDFQLDRTAAALKWLKRVSDLRPDDFANLEFLGDLYLKLKQPEKAIEAMEQALTLPDTAAPTITIFINLAEAHRQNNDLRAALKITNHGLEYHPNAVELHNSLGVCLNALGQKERSIEAFKRAITLQPFDADANFNLGYTLLEMDNETAGIAAIRRSLTQQPTFGKALTFLGQYELSVGDLAEAGRLLERLYDAYWGIPDARRLWAEWHFKAGTLITEQDEKEAESLYLAGLTVDADFADLHMGLGALYIAQDRIPEARRALNDFQRLSSDDPRGFLFMGQAFIAEGKNSEARQQLQIGLELATVSGQSATAERCRTLLREL